MFLDLFPFDVPIMFLFKPFKSLFLVSLFVFASLQIFLSIPSPSGFATTLIYSLSSTSLSLSLSGVSIASVHFHFISLLSPYIHMYLGNA